MADQDLSAEIDRIVARACAPSFFGAPERRERLRADLRELVRRAREPAEGMVTVAEIDPRTWRLE